MKCFVGCTYIFRNTYIKFSLLAVFPKLCVVHLRIILNNSRELSDLLNPQGVATHSLINSYLADIITCMLRDYRRGMY
jgi:hypothetical protein